MLKNKLIIKIYTNSDLILKFFLVSLSIFYCYLATLTKHSDFWSLNYLARIFASGKFDVYAEFAARTGQENVALTMHPPAFYNLQGYWLRLGSLIFKYELVDYNLSDPSNYPYFYQLWGMITYLIALFALVLIAYYSLRNKWLCLLCFGPFTFISLIVMGQTDIFCALLIYLSMIFALKSFYDKNYIIYSLLSSLTLGLSISFKTYGGILFPIYFLFFLLIFKTRMRDPIRVYGISASAAVVFAFSAFYIWLPYLKWFKTLMINGESSFLWNLQIAPLALPPYHNISIWFLGYCIILYDLFYNILNNQKLLYNDLKYFIFYCFAMVAWFFSTVYNHPQWWLFMVPVALFALDHFRSKINNLLILLISFFFLFYPMIWTNNIDLILRHYIPVFYIAGQYATILSTTLVSLLIIWIIELKRELGMGKTDSQK